jgi:hypothetical protein
VEVDTVVVAADGGVLVVFGEEVAVVEASVAGAGLVEGGGSMMMVRVEVAVRPALSVTTY